MMKIIQHTPTGEKQCVYSLDGYGPDWKIIEEGVTRPRGHCVREGGRWKVDRDSHLEAKIQRLTRRQMVELLITRLARIEAHLDLPPLEDDLAALYPPTAK